MVYTAKVVVKFVKIAKLRLIFEQLFCNRTMQLNEFKKRYVYDPQRDLIGTGGFAKVYKATDLLKQTQVALKFYQSSAGDKYGVVEEIKKVVGIHHPNLVRHFDAVLLQTPTMFDEEATVQVGISEYINGGDLNDFLRTFPTNEQIKKVVHGILSGLDCLHQNGIIHRDIKPQNILMQHEGEQWIPKITDFGLAKRLEQGSVSSKLLGTMEYMAPEQFDTQRYGKDGKLHTNTDLWAFGVILCEMFAGDLPFGNRNEQVTHEQLLQNIFKKDLSSDIAEVPEPFQSMINKCIVRHAGKRVASARELLDMLEGKAPTNAHEGLIASPNDGLTSTEKQKILLVSILFTPLAGWFFYMQQKRQARPSKAAGILDLMWWIVPAWLGFWLFVLCLLIFMAYQMGSL